MRPPKCILCEGHHWTRDPHVLSGVTVRPMVREFLGNYHTVLTAAETTPRIVAVRGVFPDLETPDRQAKLRTITADKAETPDTVTASCGHRAKRPARGPLPRFCSDTCRKRASRAR